MQDDSGEEMEWVVEATAKDAGDRLDGVLARGLEEFSRSRVEDLILAGAVSINGQTVSQPKYKVKPGDSILLLAPAPEEAEPTPEDIPLDILFEDDQLIGALHRAVDAHLTERQRLIFQNVTMDDVPIDVLAERLGTTRGAIYKILHDARAKLRRALTDAGYGEQLND